MSMETELEKLARALAEYSADEASRTKGCAVLDLVDAIGFTPHGRATWMLWCYRSRDSQVATLQGELAAFREIVDEKDAEIAELDEEIEQWKAASGLEVNGDPEGITPEMCEKNVQKLYQSIESFKGREARVINLVPIEEQLTCVEPSQYVGAYIGRLKSKIAGLCAHLDALEVDFVLRSSLTEAHAEIARLKADLGKAISELNCRETQATDCAGCGRNRHTPLRRDEMGGYVCLTCIDKALDTRAQDKAELVEGMAVLLDNWPANRDGMDDAGPLPAGAHKCRALLAKHRKENS